MARITDLKKVERLKQSTMKLVVERGFGGASAALIASDAQVASGYFYMHYAGKYEMVNAILQEVYLEVLDELKGLVQHGNSFEIIVEKIVRHFVDMANSDPVKIKFLYVLTNDYSFVIDQQIRENIYRIIRQISELGKQAGSLDSKITDEDLFLILLTTIFQYINQYFKNHKQETKIQEEETQHLLYLVQKFLK